MKFKRGEIFYFDNVSDSLNKFAIGSNMEITSYGTGDHPEICGYLTLQADWIYKIDNVYYSSLDTYNQCYSLGDNKRINIGSIRVNTNGYITVSFRRVYKKELLYKNDDFFIDYVNSRIYVYADIDPSKSVYELARVGSCFTFQKQCSNAIIRLMVLAGTEYAAYGKMHKLGGV